jgi:hypothetical protein
MRTAISPGYNVFANSNENTCRPAWNATRCKIICNEGALSLPAWNATTTNGGAPVNQPVDLTTTVSKEMSVALKVREMVEYEHWCDSCREASRVTKCNAQCPPNAANVLATRRAAMPVGRSATSKTADNICPPQSLDPITLIINKSIISHDG